MSDPIDANLWRFQIWRILFWPALRQLNFPLCDVPPPPQRISHLIWTPLPLPPPQFCGKTWIYLSGTLIGWILIQSDSHLYRSNKEETLFFLFATNNMHHVRKWSQKLYYKHKKPDDFGILEHVTQKLYPGDSRIIRESWHIWHIWDPAIAAIEVCLFVCFFFFAACASPEVISGTSGLFSSLNFPTETPPGSTCLWNITVPEGFVVKITFHAFLLSQDDTKTDCSDAQGARLRISDVASTEQAKDTFELCGQSIPSPVYTSTNTIQVRLKTVAQHGVIGFNASYEAISPDMCKSLYI